MLRGVGTAEPRSPLAMSATHVSDTLWSGTLKFKKKDYIVIPKGTI